MEIPTSILDSRPPMSEGLIRKAQRVLTSRDLRICQLLEEHRILTGHQIATAFFPTDRAARERLVALYRCRVLDRFRPHVAPGSAPFHYTLDVLGGVACAAERGEEPRMRRRRSAESWQRSPRLAHLLAINGFFVDLLGRERRGEGGQLVEWWSEAACSRATAGIANPDGFGAWRDKEVTVDFYLEVDRGTENSKRIAEKIEDYRELRAATGIDRPLLFWLPSKRREDAVRVSLRNTDIRVATAVANRAPWGECWLYVGDVKRRRLAELRGTEAGWS